MIIIIVAAVIILLVIVAGPLRSMRMARKYARFRAEQQVEHDKIDARFVHHEVEVNGIKWHYVEQGRTAHFDAVNARVAGIVVFMGLT